MPGGTTKAGHTGRDEADIVTLMSEPSPTPVVESDPEKQPDPTTLPPSELSRVETKAYSSFTTKQKKLIVLTASLAGFFSPLSGSIYYPALNTIADDLGITSSKVNLTVTTYMVSLAAFRCSVS